MITKAVDTKSLKQSEDFTSYSFGIKESGLAHIFNVLRNQLYSDKILAVIREYSANALDAHAEFGNQDTPIQVTLPTKLNLNFEVRDFGRGLTEREIGEIYAMYGESTKRGTNEQIGQLGLGSKSGFAYGDNFVITSWINGKKTVYNAFLDPSKVGRIAKMEQVDSDEPQGIKISIPVSLDDVDAFREKAFSLYERFAVTPEIVGVSSEELQSNFNPKKILIEAKDKSWQITNNVQYQSADSFVVMGNIAYPLERSSLNLPYGDARVQMLSSCGVILNVPIGTVEVAASREALQYTDITQLEIKKRLDEVLSDLPKILSESFANCKTLWEAKNLFANTFSHGGFGYTLSNIVKKDKIVWNGKKLSNSWFDFSNNQAKGASCHIYAKPSYFNRYNARGKRVKSGIENKLTAQPNKKILIVENDVNLERGMFNRITPLLEDYDGRPSDMKQYDAVYLVNFGPNKDQVVKDLNFDAPMAKISELESVKLTTIYPRSATANVNSHGVTADKKKHQSLEFTFDYDCDKGSYENQRSAFFKAEAVNLNEVKDGIYVELDRFWVDFDASNREAHPHAIKTFISNLNKYLNVPMPKIYAFKSKSVHKVQNKSNWTTLAEWGYKQMLDFVKRNNTGQLIKDIEHLKAHYQYVRQQDLEIIDLVNQRRDFGRQEDRSNNFEKYLDKIVVEDSLMKKYLNAWNDMRPTKNQEKQLEVLSNVDGGSYRELNIDLASRIEKLDFKPTHNLFDLVEQVMKRYDLLSAVDYHTYNTKKIEKLWTKVVEYVNLIDVTVVSKKNK